MGKSQCGAWPPCKDHETPSQSHSPQTFQELSERYHTPLAAATIISATLGGFYSAQLVSFTLSSAYNPVDTNKSKTLTTSLPLLMIIHWALIRTSVSDATLSVIRSRSMALIRQKIRRLFLPTLRALLVWLGQPPSLRHAFLGLVLLPGTVLCGNTVVTQCSPIFPAGIYWMSSRTFTRSPTNSNPAMGPVSFT